MEKTVLMCMSVNAFGFTATEDMEIADCAGCGTLVGYSPKIVEVQKKSIPEGSEIVFMCQRCGFKTLVKSDKATFNEELTEEMTLTLQSEMKKLGVEKTVDEVKDMYQKVMSLLTGARKFHKQNSEVKDNAD